jgi:hypothetical protein
MRKRIDKTDKLFILLTIMMVPSAVILVWFKYWPLWLGIPLLVGLIGFIIYAYIDSKQINREMAEWEIQYRARSQRLDELEASANQEPEAPPQLNPLQRFLRHLAYRQWFRDDTEGNHTIH